MQIGKNVDSRQSGCWRHSFGIQFPEESRSTARWRDEKQEIDQALSCQEEIEVMKVEHFRAAQEIPMNSEIKIALAV